ncbi:hypothetical protein AMECASPLE_039279 [Ameca splendens]|uniref:Uncharacterized protein n=1 Tax=Ameca splendens TaxID=208324 RepID=A0ABV0YJV2_9TELE
MDLTVAVNECCMDYMERSHLILTHGTNRKRNRVGRILKEGCTVPQLVVLLPCSKKVLGSTSGRGLSAWSLHVLPVHAWVLSGYSDFLPQSKNMPVRLIGLSKLLLGVNECVLGCLSCVSLCCPAMDWRPVLARRLLEIGTSPPAALYGRSGFR